MEFSQKAREDKQAKLQAELDAAVQEQNFKRADIVKGQIEALKSAGPVAGGPPEKWILGASEFDAFGRFLSNRMVSPNDVTIECEDMANAASAWGTERCLECKKLSYGGTYGTIGVVTPAFPPQEAAAGCLSLSNDMNVEYDEKWILSDDSFDASSPPRASAFCRVA